MYVHAQHPHLVCMCILNFHRKCVCVLFQLLQHCFVCMCIVTCHNKCLCIKNYHNKFVFAFYLSHQVCVHVHLWQQVCVCACSIFIVHSEFWQQECVCACAFSILKARVCICACSTCTAGLYVHYQLSQQKICVCILNFQQMILCKFNFLNKDECGHFQLSQKRVFAFTTRVCVLLNFHNRGVCMCIPTFTTRAIAFSTFTTSVCLCVHFELSQLVCVHFQFS